jgi:hypothetical protein
VVAVSSRLDPTRRRCERGDPVTRSGARVARQGEDWPMFSPWVLNMCQSKIRPGLVAGLRRTLAG